LGFNAEEQRSEEHQETVKQGGEKIDSARLKRCLLERNPSQKKKGEPVQLSVGLVALYDFSI